MVEAPDIFTESEKAHIESGGLTELKDERVAPEAEAPEKEADSEGEVELNEPEAGSEEQPRGKSGHVPLAVLEKERAKARQSLEQTRRENEEYRARAEARFALLEQQRLNPQPQSQQAPQPEFKIPDPRENPIEALEIAMNGLNVLAQREQQRENQQKEQENLRKAQAAFQNDVEYVRKAHSEAVKSDPDYEPAYKFVDNMLRKEAIRELHLTGQPINAQTITRGVEMREAQIILSAKQRNVHPVVAVKQLAEQIGFTPEMARQFAAASKAPDAPATLESRLAAADRGRADNISLGQASGSASAGPMTFDKFMSMPDDQARAWAEKYPAAMKKLSGG